MMLKVMVKSSLNTTWSDESSLTCRLISWIAASALPALQTPSCVVWRSWLLLLITWLFVHFVASLLKVHQLRSVGHLCLYWKWWGVFHLREQHKFLCWVALRELGWPRCKEQSRVCHLSQQIACSDVLWRETIWSALWTQWKGTHGMLHILDRPFQVFNFLEQHLVNCKSFKDRSTKIVKSFLTTFLKSLKISKFWMMSKFLATISHLAAYRRSLIRFSASMICCTSEATACILPLSLKSSMLPNFILDWDSASVGWTVSQNSRPLSGSSCWDHSCDKIMYRRKVNLALHLLVARTNLCSSGVFSAVVSRIVSHRIMLKAFTKSSFTRTLSSSRDSTNFWQHELLLRCHPTPILQLNFVLVHYFLP